jgi:uncharacterized membrane protein
MSLLRKALVTLLGGTSAVMVTAVVLGLIHRDIPISREIMARTSPNLIDLMVALAGGAAGAYATVSPRLSAALVGVAIATALEPPLSSGCILLARGEYQLALGAFLLVFTNMVAIQFAASVVLLLCGYGGVSQKVSFQLAAFLKRNAISIGILIILGLSLTANLVKVVRQQLFERQEDCHRRIEHGETERNSGRDQAVVIKEQRLDLPPWQVADSLLSGAVCAPVRMETDALCPSSKTVFTARCSH